MPRTVHSARYRRLRDLLVQAREKADMTQAEVAAKLKRPQSFVAKTEGGERRLDLLEFVELAEAIGADPAELLGALRSSRK